MKVFYKIGEVRKWDGVCNIVGCYHQKQCSQHTTADGYRSEGGMTPDLKVIQGYVCCSKIDTEIDDGCLKLTKNNEFIPYKNELED